MSDSVQGEALGKDHQKKTKIHSVLNYIVVYCFPPVFVGMPVAVILVHYQELLLS